MSTDELLSAGRAGHFLLESGFHTDLWLDLDLFFLRPRALRPLVSDLAERLSGYRVSAVCGPLVGGAFLAQTVAAEPGVECCHTSPDAG